MRWITLLAVLMAEVAVAQFRIIPQEQLHSLANPTLATKDIRFTPAKVSFGKIDEMMGVWQGSATLTNYTSQTVAVTEVKSTCGCLQATLASRVLAPNKSVTVQLKYYPRGHAGEVAQRVLLYTSLSKDKPSAVLHLEGLVLASSDRSDDYPYMRGALRLRQERITFKGGQREGLRIACMNGGAEALHLSINEGFCPKGVKAYFEPSILAPKQEGHLIVEYSPEGADSGSVRDLRGAMMLYIEGISLPLRQRAVEVVIE